MVKSLRSRLEQEKGRQRQVLDSIQDLQSNLVTLQINLEDILKAQKIVQQVAQETQDQLSFQISDLVSLALAAVFPDPYEFRVEFVQRRGKTEADLEFVRDGQPHSPLFSSGGGPVDVASFALRVSLWSLAKSSRPVIVLDEPFKHLSRDLHGRAAEMLRTLAREVGLQVIMVSHSEELVEGADRVFYVGIKNGVSLVVQQ